jgi:hypothetical protein
MVRMRELYAITPSSPVIRSNPMATTTTLLGEEELDTTHAEGEEDPTTTRWIGEEGYTTDAIGEEGGTTTTYGEEDAVAGGTTDDPFGAF